MTKSNSNNNLNSLGSTLVFPTLLICAFILGYSLTNLFHFFIEDAYLLPISHLLFFGLDYATSASWVIVAGALFLGLAFYETHLLKRGLLLVDSTSRRIFLSIFLALMCFIFALSLVNIVYGYLSGNSPFPELLKIGVVLLMSVLGGIFSVFERSRTSITQNNASFYGMVGTFSFLTVLGVWVTIANANPATLQLVKTDQTHIQNIQMIGDVVKDYYRTHEKLPNTLLELVDQGSLNESILQEKDSYRYEAMANGKNFELCTTFNYASDSKEARRTASSPHKAGEQCFHYNVEEKN